MRVFVTGATGYVGSAIVAALVRAGHRVSGLSRRPEADAALVALGAEPVRGALGGLAKLGPQLVLHEALVHAAVDYGLGPPGDREAVEAMLAASRQVGPRVVVYTSGVWVLGEASDADESAPVDEPAAAVAWRPAHERAVLDAATVGVATAVVRPGMVYGEKRGVVNPMFFERAVRTGAAEVVGDGANRWSFVHRDDLAELYRLVVERGARGVFHGVDGAPARLADAARAASAAAGKGGAVRSVPVEEARKTLGPVADAMALDQAVVTARAAELGWRPRHPSFVVAAGAAFREWSA